jgi:hypothetical protein
MSTPELEAIVARGVDADDILRDVVAALAARFGWAGVFFVEQGDLALGPQAGTPQPERRVQVPVTWNGDRIADLAVDGAGDEHRSELEQAAGLIAGQCLVGWDIGGEDWEP